jgi:hypothetical protein
MKPKTTPALHHRGAAHARHRSGITTSQHEENLRIDYDNDRD